MSLAMPSPIQIGNRWYLRVRTPQELQKQARGRTIYLPVAGIFRSVKIGDSVKLSLETREPVIAKARFSETYAALQSVWLTMRTAPRPLTHKQMLVLAGELRAVFVKAFDDEPGSPRTWMNVLALNSQTMDGRLNPLKIGTAENQAEDMERRFGPLVDITLTQKGLAIPAEQRPTLLNMVVHAINEAAIVNLAKADGDYSDDGATHRYPAFEAPSRLTAEKAAVSIAVAPHGGSEPAISFTSVIDEEVRRRSLGKNATPLREATIRKFRAAAESFRAYRQNDDATTVTAREADAWKYAMQEEGELSNNTIGQRIQNLRTVIQWARDHSLGEIYPAGNPLDIVKRPAFQSVSGADRTFTMDEAATALLAARKETAPELRWLPWMCAYSGARINELAQLTKADFFQVGSDWFFRVTTAGGKSLKNRFSERRVPVHPQLIEEGLITFVTGLKIADSRRIFPERTQPNISEWLRGKVGLTREELAPNHGWRHLFEDLCTVAGMPDAERNYITGRTTGKSNEDYGKSQAALPGLAMQMRAVPTIPLRKAGTA